jgi:glutathione peroxidase
VYDIGIESIEGSPNLLDTIRGKVALFVNVASRCGLTPQYEGLVRLQQKYADRGFTVVGFPCNQFLGQEPGTADEIKEFCSVTYGVDFPLSEKIDVNGEHRHPLYERLTAVDYTSGKPAGDISWNFEKFVIDRDGAIVGRFRPQTEPEDERIIELIERRLDAADH